MSVPPALPPRTTASLPSRGVTFEGPRTWRASIAAFTALLLAAAVFIGLIIVGVYVWKDKAAYEELVDYMDKTISISKINYNPALGVYQPTEKEHEALSNQRTYKNTLWYFFACELGVYVFLSVALILYFSTDITSNLFKILFWAFFIAGCLYTILISHVFAFTLSSFDDLGEKVEKLLNHAIPHNPGGLQQLENRLGCTFDYNLYSHTKRTQNPRNTCDLQLQHTFMPGWLLWFILGLQMVPLIIGVLLIAKKTPVSETVAQFVEKFKSNPRQRLYKKKPGATSEKKSTTFGVSSAVRGPSTPLPPVPSPSVDHSVSYNNAAYFATAGVGSSRSSEISRIDAHDLFRTTHLAGSGSIQSEV